MENLQVATDVDWMACELIEQIPGKVSGGPSCVERASCPTPLWIATTLGRPLRN